MSNDANDQPLKTGMEFCGEFLVPGGSNFLKGNWKQGGLYAVIGLAARAAFGVPGLLVVSSDSISVALTGRHIHQFIGRGILGEKPAASAPVAAAPVAPPQTAEALESAPRPAVTAAAKKRRASTIKKTKRS